MIMALAAAAVISPLAALADPPAAGVPAMPAPFIGAPTNDNPNNGQFGVNFDDRGRFTGIGSAPEHYASFDLTPARERRQARANDAAGSAETPEAKMVFTAFTERLRDVASPQAAIAAPAGTR